MADVIQSLWIGGRLSVMERLCISSFLRNGHPFHLYVYEEPTGVPPGTIVLDANRILPADRIFTAVGGGDATCRENKSYAGFSDFFRYKLLLEQGGWWVDTDMVCLKPFEFSSEYVFSSQFPSEGGGIWQRLTRRFLNTRRERTTPLHPLGVETGRSARRRLREQVVNIGAIKVPTGSGVMQYAWDACDRMNAAELKWCQAGPDLARKAIKVCALETYVQPPDVFCPVPWSEWDTVLDPTASWRFDEGPLGNPTSGVHLWNDMWRLGGRDKGARYPSGCLYERLKERYLA